MPEYLDEEELADCRAGRNAVYQLAALTMVRASRLPTHSRVVGRDAWTNERSHRARREMARVVAVAELLVRMRHRVALAWPK
jgi:hypothetical protein